MAYRRPDSSYYQVRRKNLPGFGDTGVLSSKVRNKRVADRMERTLEEVAERALVEPSYRAIVEAVLEKRLDLPALQRHHAAGDLDALRASLTDPPLAEAAAAFAEAERVEGMARLGLDQVLAMAPPRARLSYLRDPRTIVELCRRSEAGEPRGDDGDLGPRRKKNSVRRTVLRALSMLLRHELGRAERDRLFAEVRYSAEDDTREVLLQPAEIRRLLDACDEVGDPELRTFVRLSLVTSADRGVLLAGNRGKRAPAPGLRVRQVRVYAEGPAGDEVYTGEVFLADTKTASRPRTVPVTDALCRELLALCVRPDGTPKGADEPVFEMAYRQLHARWDRARKHAGLDHVRVKDLRAQSAIYGERAGVPLTVMARAMGHADEAMTRRYQQHQAALTGDQVRAIEREMGLTG